MSAALQSLMREPPVRVAAPEPVFAGMPQFIAVGALGALSFVVLSTMVIWLQTGIADWIVNAVCYAVLIGPVYLLQRSYSFRSCAPHRQALPRYLAVQAMALALATMFSFVLHGMWSLPTVLASLLVIALTSGVNFLVLRGWAFARTTLVAAAA